MFIKSDEPFLESLGWTVECQSPLEIRHVDGSFATGYAATVLVDYLKSEAAAENPPAAELRALFDRVENLLKVAAERPETDYDRWKRCYELVFSDECSARIHTLLGQLNISFKWYDPDLDYEDDVRAFGNALAQLKEEISPFLAVLSPEI